MPGIYMNIIFYLKNLKKTSTGNKNFKKFVPTFRQLRLLQGNVIVKSRPLNIYHKVRLNLHKKGWNVDNNELKFKNQTVITEVCPTERNNELL